MTAPMYAAELLAYRLCDPRCLLAMESAAGDRTACTCTCGGLYHAALVLTEVMPQPWTCPACGLAPEDCVRAGVCCRDCRHPAQALDMARTFLAPDDAATVAPALKEAPS